MPIVKWKRLFSWRVNDSNFWQLSLFGAVAVQKNIRDAGINPPKETQVTQEEYSE
ncbi:hypothetical protein [Zymomonas mobilis]|uniref:hypothetical protein n=1 Tax=Zymomonas mobilis TaxID=542 RepID=UPI00191C21F7|nr:hypothetical protein [Zymomonas mobilis]